MPTPEAWYRAAKDALERENARIRPKYSVERRDSAGNASEVRLFEVSVVHEPPPEDEAVFIGRFEVIEE